MSRAEIIFWAAAFAVLGIGFAWIIITAPPPLRRSAECLETMTRRIPPTYVIREDCIRWSYECRESPDHEWGPCPVRSKQEDPHG